ncbi:hypothetical protein M408DRAFT_331879 [Serendipita vermifera MAFF 305830]|uniref:WSC domain-containing protein n=1 Tax=Serendipita vermifera MAFF 305830 TaxID=933852 RepID=A0A0C3AHX5_SERVB|nr:hypothetical protein M408DRAFT_331879 [Serendipita vermifera MAFF 305830]
MCTGSPDVCGGSARLTVWQNQGTVSDPDRYSLEGPDSVTNRALSTQVSIPDVTIEKCASACANSGFKYAGVEYGSVLCGNEIHTSANSGLPATDGCTMPCAGNQDQRCGGPDRLNLYYSGPVQVETVGDFKLKGCYSDEVGNRALPIRQYVDGGMTVEKCTDKCFSLGYTFAGLEYANVNCSSAIGSSAVPKTDGCTMPCEGAPNTQICGGSDRLTLYEYTGSSPGTAPTLLETYNDWSSQGCYVDTVNARVLTPMPSALAPMTVGNCVDACEATGYTIAGVEYASKCDGDSHLCGGPDRLNVYKKAPPAPVQKYTIQVLDYQNNQVLGWIARSYNQFGRPTYTEDFAQATTYEKEGPTGTNTVFDLRQTDGSDVTYTYFGAFYGDPQFQHPMAMVQQTPAGSKGAQLGTIGIDGTMDQSCIWSFDPNALGQRLQLRWVNIDDGSITMLNPFYNFIDGVGALYGVVDINTYQTVSPQAKRLRLYLNEVVEENPQ